MWKWTKRIAIVIIALAIGYAILDYYKAGFHTRPQMPPNSFSLSYKSGLRAIVVGLPDETETRRYFGIPMEVPFYLENSWSFCHSPTDEEQEKAAELLNHRDWPGARLDAICTIDVDGEKVVRGIIATVPKV